MIEPSCVVNRSLGRRVRDEALGIHQRAARAVRSERVLSRDNPFRFGDLPIVNPEPQRRDGFIATFSHDPEISGLTAHRIHVSPLNHPETVDRLPGAGARTHDDGVFGLTKADEQRRGGRIMFDEGAEVQIQNVLQAGPIAACPGGRRIRATRKHAGHARQSTQQS
jgi:hypothetical protein